MLDNKLKDKLIKWYIEYAYTFAEDGKLLPAMKKLKFDHSMRVCSVARKIAVLEGWSEHEVLIAEICGLYHDIGRYIQYKKYKTFQDYRSVNHAECGCEVIMKTGCLRELDIDERRIVLEATRLHNVKELPPEVDPQILKFVNLVRDADKLDIYHVIFDAISNDRLGDYPEITHGVDLEGEPSAIILEQVLRHEKVSYTDMRSLVDFLLILLQWAYEMNYKASYKIMLARRLVDKISSLIPEHPLITEIVQLANSHVFTETSDD